MGLPIVIEWLNVPGLWLAAIPIIGSRMMAFCTLIHDASHYLLFKTRWLNNFFGEVFLTWPLFSTLGRYRHDHWQHHAHLRTDRDTETPLRDYEEFQFPMKKPKWWRIAFLDVSGLHFLYYQLKRFMGKQKGSYPTEKFKPQLKVEVIRYAFYFGILATFWYFGAEILLLKYWLIPFVTWFAFSFRLRATAEHFQVPTEKLFQTRTLKLNMLERFMFFPHNLGFHTEHHLHPGVPCYKLSQLHQILMVHPSFKNRTHVTIGLKGLINELTTK